MRKWIGLILTLTFLAALNGCGYLIAGGAGAAAGYEAKERGYDVQSPVVKEEPAAPAE